MPRDEARERLLLQVVVSEYSTYALDAIGDRLQADLFTRPDFRRVCLVIADLRARGFVPEWSQVRAKIQQRDVTLDDPSDIDELAVGVPSRPNLENLNRTIEELERFARLRRRIVAADSVAHAVRAGEDHSAALMAFTDVVTEGVGNTLIDDTALMALPEPRMLVADRLPAEGTALLIGTSGVGKSVVATDLGLCVGTGCHWQDAPILTRGPVVHVVAEGGLRRYSVRVRAAKLAAGFSLEESVGLYAHDGPVNLLDLAAVSRFAAIAAALKPVLIIIDTLARCLPAADENSAKDMGVAVAALDTLRARTGATILAVHHTPKDSTRTDARGSGALTGAVDTILTVTPLPNGRLTLGCSKQRDGAPFLPRVLQLRPYGGSVVPTPVDERLLAIPLPDDFDNRVLVFLQSHPSGTTWSAAARGLKAGKGRVGDALQRLVAARLARETETGKGSVFTATSPAVQTGPDGSQERGPTVPVRRSGSIETGPTDRCQPSPDSTRGER